ncbi:MAG TPA: DUF1579 family protein [Thermoanaerobaculia bacterium]|nr:DUF1579 family protein [Thermoanaerobaculia bacterium]
MKVFAVAVLSLVLLATTPTRVSTLYQRVTARLEAEPELARVVGLPTPQIQEARWLLGRWAITARVFSSDGSDSIDRGEGTVEPILGGTWLQLRDRYSGEPEDLGFLTYNAATKRWMAIGIDKSGNAITAIGERWEGNRLVLIAENADIIGERVTLRQTIEKRSPREYRVLNEERLPDGTWAAIDEYVYTKN